MNIISPPSPNVTIPIALLLPPLTAKEKEAFAALVADYRQAKAAVSKYGSDARVARKRELRDQQRNGNPADMARIGAELATLEESYQTARRAAKQQLRNFGQRYSPLMPRLLDKAEAHADKLMEQAAKAYAAHFAPLGIEPQGESPVVAQLREWKKQLAARRGTVELALAGNLTCVNCPTAILPYPVEGVATEGGLL